MKKLYFENKNSKELFDKKWFKDWMIERNTSTIEAYKAVPTTREGFFWCTCLNCLGERPGLTCDKNCPKYSPDKDNKCKYRSRIIYVPGDKITLKL